MLLLKSKRLAFWGSLILMAAALGGLLFWLEKDVTISVDNQEIKTYTFKPTVGEVLAQKNIELGPRDLVEPASDTRLEKGTHITVIRAFKTKVLVDGQETEILSTPVSVARALDLAAITLGPDDIVTPGLRSLTRPGQDIKVVRVSHKMDSTDGVIPFPVQRVSDNTLEKGLTRTLKKGNNGLERQNIKITYHDGEEVKREVVDRRTIREPVPRVIAMGTITSVSRGNLRLDFSRAMLAEATAYTYTGNRTASGRHPEVGLVAVDTGVIPMGTRLYIEGYGFAQAADRGRSIQGNRVDVFMESKDQCLRWGRRTVKLYVLD
ncbi:MAG: DUF348 domain-containing protein [Syntrophomonadaceae bacterium]|nr:DUF348 domain-containing protein [Syntrophomonadaceae bacterium]